MKKEEVVKNEVYHFVLQMIQSKSEDSLQNEENTYKLYTDKRLYPEYIKKPSSLITTKTTKQLKKSKGFQ